MGAKAPAEPRPTVHPGRRFPSLSVPPREDCMARFRFVFLLLLLGSLACDSQETRRAQHREKGDAFLKEEKWAEAELEFKSALAVDPNSAAAHYGLALAYLGGKDPRRAYWELEETVRLDPNHVEARLRHGEFLLFGKREE